MRKIGSDKEDERKRKRNVLLISLFILFVLLIGTIGYGFLSKTDYANQDETSQKIRYTGSSWIVNINGQDYQFSNSPDSVSNISVNIDGNLASYVSSPLYIASDNNAVNVEIYSALNRHISRIQNACYGPCEKDLPEKDCTENLIVWKDSPENKVFQTDKCIFIEGDLAAVDAFLYKFLGYS